MEIVSGPNGIEEESLGKSISFVGFAESSTGLIHKHTPVIGILHEKEKFNPVLNEDEVDTIFDCPLEMFLKGKPAVLKYVKFQNVCSLTMFIEDNQSGEEITKIQKIGLFGSTVETTDMEGLKKIEDN